MKYLYTIVFILLIFNNINFLAECKGETSPVHFVFSANRHRSASEARPPNYYRKRLSINVCFTIGLDLHPKTKGTSFLETVTFLDSCVKRTERNDDVRIA